MSSINSKNIVLVFAITFIASGILGFIPNPLVSAYGFFEVNGMHNLLHILTGGTFFLTVILGTEKSAKLVLQIIGIAYTVVSILGFMTDGQFLLGFIQINEADKWLHVGLALIILIAGFGLSTRQE